MVMTEDAIIFITKEALEQAVGDFGRAQSDKPTDETAWTLFTRSLLDSFDRQLREPASPELASSRTVLVMSKSDTSVWIQKLMTAVQQAALDDERFKTLITAMMPTEPEVVSEAVLSQARANAAARARFLAEFPSVSSAELAELYGSTAGNRAALAGRWRALGRVFAIEAPGGLRFPLFQVDAEARPKPAIAQVVRALHDAGLEGWEVALWFAGPLASLDDKRPVDLIDTDPDRVIAAAGRVSEIPE